MPLSRADFAVCFCEDDEKFQPFLHIGCSISFEVELIMNQYLHSIEVMSFILSIFSLKKFSESVFVAGKATCVQELVVALLETVLICFSDELLNHAIFQVQHL